MGWDGMGWWDGMGENVLMQRRCERRPTPSSISLSLSHLCTWGQTSTRRARAAATSTPPAPGGGRDARLAASAGASGRQAAAAAAVRAGVTAHRAAYARAEASAAAGSWCGERKGEGGGGFVRARAASQRESAPREWLGAAGASSPRSPMQPSLSVTARRRRPYPRPASQALRQLSLTWHARMTAASASAATAGRREASRRRPASQAAGGPSIASSLCVCVPVHWWVQGVCSLRHGPVCACVCVCVCAQGAPSGEPCGVRDCTHGRGQQRN